MANGPARHGTGPCQHGPIANGPARHAVPPGPCLTGPRARHCPMGRFPCRPGPAREARPFSQAVPAQGPREREGESRRQGDGDIPSIDTTTPAAQQGPMTRARARQLNYQVKSFLAVHTNSSQNWMLLNHGDDCLILRNVDQDSIASCLDPMMRMEQPNKWESSLMGRSAHLETAGNTPSKVP